jgi:hypothetical protein
VPTLLSGEYDAREALVTINSQAGGVDAADSGVHVRADGGQRHEHDVAEGLLGVVGDPNPPAAVGDADPLVLGGVAKLVRNHEGPPGEGALCLVVVQPALDDDGTGRA